MEKSKFGFRLKFQEKIDGDMRANEKIAEYEEIIYKTDDFETFTLSQVKREGEECDEQKKDSFHISAKY